MELKNEEHANDANAHTKWPKEANTRIIEKKKRTFPSYAELRQIDGTNHPSKVNLAESPVLYWPRLVKRSDSKWFVHTNRFLPILTGILPSNMKSIHFAIVSSEAGD